MNTKIRLTSNGNFSPNVTFDLGFKYESVDDTLEFILPDEYKKATNHYYLLFKMKRMETIILPVVDYKFTITRTITERAGIYDMIFIATENEIVNGDIDEAVRVYVSNTMKGEVKDNFLNDPITAEVTDKNIELYYNKLDALADDLTNKIETGYYQGDYYYPTVDEFGYITWVIREGEASEVPLGTNIRGPRGGYYEPYIEDGILKWTASLEEMPSIEETNIDQMVETHTDSYLEDHFIDKVQPLVDTKVVEEVKNTIQFIWDEENKQLFIYSADKIVTEDGDSVAYGND